MPEFLCHHYNVCLEGSMWFSGGSLDENMQWVCQDCGHALSAEELRDRDAMFDAENEEVNHEYSF